MSVILVFVGTKMMLVDLFKIPVGISLMVVLSILIISVVLSKMFPPKAKAA